MTTGKSQHIVPQFYLRSFLQPGYVYRRGTARPAHVNSPKNVAAEDWFYSGATLDDKRSLDEMNSRIEGNKHIQEAFRRLLNRNTRPSSDDRAPLAILIANLFLRVPATFYAVGKPTVDALERMNQKISALEAMLQSPSGRRALMDAPPQLPGPGSWQGTPQTFRTELESLRAQLAVGKPMMRDIMSCIPDVARVITRMNWTLVTAPNRSFFVTSDNPVALTHIDGSPTGVGWESSTAVATLPVSGRLCLVMSYTSTCQWRRRQATQAQVDGLNRRAIALAWNAIYTPERHPLAEEWLRNCVMEKASKSQTGD